MKWDLKYMTAKATAPEKLVANNLLNALSPAHGGMNRCKGKLQSMRRGVSRDGFQNLPDPKANRSQ